MAKDKISRRDFLRLSGLTIGSALLTSCTGKGKFPLGFGDERPNFIVILSDDQRYDTMEYMPKTQALIFDQGVTFSQGYVSSPLCGPSRANILTGMHVHNHGVLDNNGELKIGTFVEDLQENGYFTGLVGKYINKWKGEPRPEYDYWASIFRDASPYYDPDININGEWHWQIDGYITDILGDLVVDFVDEASKKLRPFFLLFAPTAPHAPATPAIEDEGLYPNLAPHRPPSYNEEDFSDKPASITHKQLLTESDSATLDKFRRDQILTLASLDRAVETIVQKLADDGELNNTVIIYLSDNGKHWGEHRLDSKGSQYQESIHVPFALRYPPLVPEPYVEKNLVGSVDITPTLYDLAQLPIPENLDGESLVPLLAGGAWKRDKIYIECYPSRGHWELIHTGRYKYVETENHLSEFYDLQEDPYELENRINNPDYQALISELKAALEEKRNN